MRHRTPIGIVVLLSLLAGAGSGRCAPSLSGASVHYGNSIRIARNGAAYFNYTISNPEASPVEVRLVLRPMRQRNLTIYDHVLVVPPEARVRGRTPITIGTVESYQAELYFRDNLISTTEAIIRLPMRNDRIVFFFNDDPALGYGKFTDNENLHDTYVSTMTGAENAPEHWSGFANAHLLVIMRPDFEAMGVRRFDAVLDFAARGGTVLFADPKGIVEASRTPLQPMLPVIPMRFNAIDALHAAAVFDAPVPTWPEEGTTFLEAMPRGDGITTLEQEGLPVIRWGRYGLGRVGACMVNPSQRGIERAGAFDALWRHLLSFGQPSTFVTRTPNRPINRAMQEMTGIEIPSRVLIRRAAFGYFVLVLLGIGAGIATRRHAVAWSAVAAAALVATGVVFWYASARASGMDPRSAAILEFVAEGADTAAVESVISLFATSEQRADVESATPDNRIAALLPPPPKHSGIFGTVTTSPGRSRSGTGGNRNASRSEKRKGPASARSGAERVNRGSSEVIRDPLTVHSRDGRHRLEALVLRQNAPRFFTVMRSLRRPRASEIAPTMTWTETGLSMPRWPLPPPCIEATAAALVCRNGSFPVDVGPDGCSADIRGRDMLDNPPPEVAALRDALVACGTPSPALAVFSPLASTTSELLPEGYRAGGRTIHLFPVFQEIAETMHVPPEQISMHPTDRSTREVHANGAWQEVFQRAEQMDAAIDFRLPPGTALLQPRRITVDFVPDNRGRNIDFSLALRPRGATDASGDIAPTRVGADRLRFDVGDPGAFVDPSDGQFTIVLTARMRKSVLDPVQGLRLNTWRIQTFRVSADGRIDPRYTGRL